MKTKTFLIGIIFLIAVACEKEQNFDYNMYLGSWQATHDTTEYTISIQNVSPLTTVYCTNNNEWLPVFSSKEFERLYLEYQYKRQAKYDYCSIELVLLKHNKIAMLIMVVPSTIPTKLYEISLILEKQ